MVNFKLGDKVRLKQTQEQSLSDRYREGIGVVVIVQQTRIKQWCRVQFSGSMLDYEDYGSWRLELV